MSAESGSAWVVLPAHLLFVLAARSVFVKYVFAG